MNQVMIEDMVVTNITDKLMAKAGLVSLDIAMKEHNPKKRERITFQINTAEINIVRN
jgi:hypothetical protein